jgi:hypothetical protein
MGLFDKKKSNANIEKLSNLLSEAFPDMEMQKEDDETWFFVNGSSVTRVVYDGEAYDQHPLVRVISMVLADVKDDINIYKHLMMECIPHFGRWEVLKNDDNSTVSLFLTQSYILNDLGIGELQLAVATAAISADEFDDELKSKFGGKTSEEFYKD